MNKVVLIGRLTKEPMACNNNSRFTVAVNRMKKDEADFINCVAFGKTADTINQYLTKGSPIAIEGHIQTGSYIKGTETKYTTDVIVDRFEFIGGQAQAPAEKDLDAHLKEQLGDGLEVVDSGDIPF